MEKILILVGNRRVEDECCESYQVLVGTDYLSRNYSELQERETFLAEVSEEFAEYIVEKNTGGQVGIFNGLRIDESGKREKIDKLEESTVETFGNLLKDNIVKLMRLGEVLPIGAMN